jgi:2',3'-cyclic-nucleotide 2'-phosphodiesterase
MRPVRILMLGDLVGRPGRNLCRDKVHSWRRDLQLDAILANGENASGGNGLTCRNAGELFEYGIDFLTSGNHIWKQKDYPDLFKNFPKVIRPANYPSDLPGSGWGTFHLHGGATVAVMNLQGQVFMEPIDNPFRAAEALLGTIREEAQIVLVDFHAEATSERVAMGIFLDGKVSAVVGTHSHVPSADGRILSGGTAYQTDLGMVGPYDGVLGVDSEAILHKLTTGLPARFNVASGRVVASGAIITIDPSSGKALALDRFEEIHDTTSEEEKDNDSA